MIDATRAAVTAGLSGIAATSVAPEEAVLEVKNLGVTFRSEARLTQGRP